MALQSSGQISFSDIMVEAKGVAYGTDYNLDLNDQTLRNLAGRPYPSQSIGTNHFHGKVGGKDQQTITVGNTWLSTQNGGGYVYRAFYPEGSYIGSITDGTVDFRNNSTFYSCFWTSNNKTVVLIIAGYSYSNSGFTTIEIRPESLTGSGSTTPVFYDYRTNAGFYRGSYYNYTKWIWSGVQSNPFGTTNGHKKLVILR